MKTCALQTLLGLVWLGCGLSICPAAPARPDLAASISAARPSVFAGELLPFSVNITNLGTAGATQVKLTNTLATGATYYNVSVSQGTFTQTNNAVHVSLGSLNIGATAVLQLVTTPQAAGQLTNSAFVACAETESSLANNSASRAIDVASQFFTTNASLSAARYLHTATPLPDGRIVFIGGESPTGTLATAEMFLPAANQFTNAGAMEFYRAWHTASPLPDGRVLVTGGFGYGRHSSAEIFSPSNSTFQNLGGLMAEARMRHVAGVLTNGSIVIATGYTGGGSSENYAPYNSFFTSGPALLHERVGPSIERLADGRLLLLGGYPTSTPLGEQRCEFYVPDASPHFEEAGSLGINRYNFTTVLLSNGKVLVTGGYLPDVNQTSAAAELFDPTNGTVRRLTNMIWPRMFHTATRLTNGLVLLAGGGTAEAELFDPATEQFRPTVRMNYQRSQHTASLLANGRVLIVGGDTGAGAVAQAEIYDPTVTNIPPTVTIFDAAQSEGDSGTNLINFAITLSSPMGVPVSVNYTTYAGTAGASDYVAEGGIVVLAPGVTNGFLTAKIIGDAIFETNETIRVALTGCTNAIVARPEAMGTILNDDPMPTVSIQPSDATAEGNLRTTNRLLSVTLSGATEVPASVAFQTVSGSAQAGSDFTPANGSLTFDGVTNLSIPVQIRGDINLESNEVFTVVLLSPTNCTLGGSQCEVTLLNDDAVPGALHHFSVSLPELPSGERALTRVNLTALDVFDQPVTNFNGSVVLMAGFSNQPPAHINFEDSDFSNWTVINPGMPGEFKTYDTAGNGGPSQAYRISPDFTGGGIQTTAAINGGTRLYFSMNVADIFTGWAIYSETTTRLLIDGLTVLSNRTGYIDTGFARNVLYGYSDAFTNTQSHSLALTFVRPYYQAAALSIYTDDLTISPAPMPGTRSGAFSNGVGSTFVTFREAVTNVMLFTEDDEGHQGQSAPFTVQASGNLALSLSASPTAPSVGNNITLSLVVSNLSSLTATGVVVSNTLPVWVSLIATNTTNGTFSRSGTNLVWQIGTLTAGQKATGAVVMVATDAGTFTSSARVQMQQPDFNLTNNVASVSLQVGLPMIQSQSVTVTEQVGGVIASFPVTLSAPFAREVSAYFETSTWLPGGDPVHTNGTVVLPPFTTNAFVNVFVTDDLIYEGQEFFYMVLEFPTNAVMPNNNVGIAYAGIVNDNDPPPTFAISDATVVEGDDGTTNTVLTVTLSGATALSATVNFATASGTATAGSDFISTNGTLTFPLGTNSQTLVVRVNGNTVNESNETFFVNLSSPGNATLADAQGVGTILNDDAVPGRIDRFIWDSIPSPQITNREVPVRLTALDAFGSVLSNYSGFVTLSGTTSAGITNLGLTPLVASNFVDGVWSSNVRFTEIAALVTLRADDGSEHVGFSSAFNILGQFPLQLVMPSVVTEGDGSLGDVGRVAFTQTETNDVWVMLASSTTNDLILPTGVLIPAGQTTAVFNVTVGDNTLLDGSRTRSVTASATNYTLSTRNLTIHDNEFAVLTVNLPANTAEKASPLSGMVSINAPPATNVVVTLTSSDTTELTVPASVTLLAGQTNATFNANSVDDTLLDGTQTATVTAHVQNWQDGTAFVAVADNETNAFTLASLGFNETPFAEGRGTVSNAFRLTVGGILLSNLTVNLTSSDTTELIVPATVTILSGTNSVFFNSTAVDDTETDGTQAVTVSASAAGFTTGNLSVSILDNDPHHFTFSAFSLVQTSGVPFNLTVTAKDVNDITLTRYTNTPTFAAFGPGGALGLTTIGFSGPNGVVRGSFVGAVTVTAQVPQTVTLRAQDTLGHESISVPFQLRYPAWAGAPQISLVELIGNDVILTFPTVTNAQYTVEASSGLPPAWTPISASVAGTGSTMSITNAGAGGADARLFHLMVQPWP